MTATQWFLFFLILQVVHFLGTWKLYKKAGRQAWEAAIPIYNAIILMKIINRPKWWVILLFIPIVNLIMFPVVWVETLRSFGKNTTLDTALGVLTLGLYIYYINYTQDVKYIENRSLHPKDKAADTVSSLLFAVVVATIVHTYVMQPFTIPTGSLEKTLLVGDFLFVSKNHYGARTPMTTVAMPMVHDTIPGLKTKSYLNRPQLPYFRFPGFESIEKNDIVVFNWPIDTIPHATEANFKPIDKKTNYVKRCVGTPGDNLSFVDGDAYINGKKLILSDRARVQYSYRVTTVNGSMLDPNYLTKELRIYPDDIGFNQNDNSYFFISLTDENAAILKKNPTVESVTKLIAKAEEHPDPRIFPYTKKWNQDNFGPIYIPQAGKTVKLDKESLPFYRTIIKEYEKNDLKVEGDKIIINGQVADSYTFKQDYYYMVGDNRHNSLDSRYWGFVPADHIVGKPVFIWMSLDPTIPWSKAIDKIRWERLFTTVGGSGEPVSYFGIFVLLMAGYFIANFFIRRKKKRLDRY
ncbi:MAG: signal peptidase I [Flavobacterium lindanitolerans]|jgi:signal peptidase I|uniref:signal peptidase I n=1 Tax=Flavobacterium lindanitolerans TaxID=428988 RepID=UPI001A502D21|nr:signal peptidase I [Flavobacterium lindanitolerans]MBL7869719.1 signal peptidase I [Flavobacterium lindanitolerans]MBU7570309.1 signal peptidase I [Flavobacterium sp.]